jgi:hypothetical protein
MLEYILEQDHDVDIAFRKDVRIIAILDFRRFLA